MKSFAIIQIVNELIVDKYKSLLFIYFDMKTFFWIKKNQRLFPTLNIFLHYTRIHILRFT